MLTTLGCAIRTTIMLLPRRWRYRADITASLLSACLCALTLSDPTWIERWFAESPDAGGGSAERWIMGAPFWSRPSLPRRWRDARGVPLWLEGRAGSAAAACCLLGP